MAVWNVNMYSQEIDALLLFDEEDEEKLYNGGA